MVEACVDTKSLMIGNLERIGYQDAYFVAQEMLLIRRTRGFFGGGDASLRRHGIVSNRYRSNSEKYAQYLANRIFLLKLQSVAFSMAEDRTKGACINAVLLEIAA